MSELIFSGYGVDILKTDGRFYIVYDTGGIGSCDKQSEITAQEVLEAQKSENDAHSVLLRCEKRELEKYKS